MGLEYSSTIASVVKRLETRDPLPPLAPVGAWDSKLTDQIQDISLEALFDGQPIKDSTMGHALQSGLLLWNDALDASHTISQNIESKTGSYWHGIMHRREPDYSNAKYWFGRVGAHPIFPALRDRALELLQSDSTEPEPLTDYAKAIVETEEWDTFRFIDWCQDADADESTPEAVKTFLQTVQIEEIKLLLNYSYQQTFTE